MSAGGFPRRSLKSLFVAALELAGAERGAFLDEACGGDADLRAELDLLLRCDARAGADAPSVETGSTRALRDEEPPEREIGPYHAITRSTQAEAERAPVMDPAPGCRF